jgi:hypothetical protein
VEGPDRSTNRARLVDTIGRGDMAIPTYTVVMIAAGLAMDATSLVLQIRKCRSLVGPSGIPVFPALLYIIGVAFSRCRWLPCLGSILLLLCLHVFCQSVGPTLYSLFLNGRGPLHRAVVMDRIHSIRCLLQMGVDPNTQDNVGWTPLHVAVAKGNSEAIKLLVSAGADAHAGNANGVTPIQLAKAVHPDVLETLSHIR